MMGLGTILLSLVALAGASASIIVVIMQRAIRKEERRKIASIRRCVFCAHDLRAGSERCPECLWEQPVLEHVMEQA